MKPIEFEQKQNEERKQNVKLTREEIQKFENFTSFSEEEIDTLSDFVYNISVALYKSNQHGQS